VVNKRLRAERPTKGGVCDRRSMHILFTAESKGNGVVSAAEECVNPGEEGHFR